MLSKLKPVLDQSNGVTHAISVTYGGRPLFRGPTIDKYN